VDAKRAFRVICGGAVISFKDCGCAVEARTWQTRIFTAQPDDQSDFHIGAHRQFAIPSPRISISP